MISSRAHASVVFVISGNEPENITKCISSILASGCSAHVLDSSSDQVTTVRAREAGATVEKYNYCSHLDTYNDLTSRHDDGCCLIIDADMEVSRELVADVALSLSHYDVHLAPIRMWVEGKPLIRGSLCPAKPIGFRFGKQYFFPSGHAERLHPGVPQRVGIVSINHNDLKPYESFLRSQIRYASALSARYGGGEIGFRDRIRSCTPIMLFATPLFSLLFRGGITTRAGIIYAIDRLIAEALMLRQALVQRMRHPK